MSLPEPLIILLQDEAYLDLAQDTVREALDGIQAQKEEVSSTRPPFGIIATKRMRDAFTSSMQAVLDTEAGLHTRLAKIEVVAKSIKGQLRPAIHSYLETALPDYGAGTRVLAGFDAWERCLVEEYGEMMKGYARELKNTRMLVQSTPTFTADVYARRIRAFAELQLEAENLDSIATLLDVSGQRISNLCGTLYAEVQAPPPPFAQQTPWVEQIVTVGDADMMVALAERETAVRAHLGDELASIRAQAAAAREKLGIIAATCLDNYWEQLRAHAKQYYVQESDVDEVLTRLEARYVTADIRRHRQAIAQSDPYGVER
jgi:hypothetical protein